MRETTSPTPLPGAHLTFSVILLCLALTGQAQPEQTLTNQPEQDFAAGMQALGDAQTADPQRRRHLYRQAERLFHGILVRYPDNQRVRLELARTFFLQGKDRLSRRHFERVLAGGELPVPVMQNIYAYLHAIQARKRWRGYLGAALAPDSNLNAASDDNVVYIDTLFGRLPFEYESPPEARSGLGLALWTGGEHLKPLGDRLRLRLGADLHTRLYEDSHFNHTYLSVWAGPQLRAAADVSLLASASRQWLNDQPLSDEGALRLEITYGLTPGLRLHGALTYRERTYDTLRNHLNGPGSGYTIRLSWLPAPIFQLDLHAGADKEHTAVAIWRTTTRWLAASTALDLPAGFTLGASIQVRRTRFDGPGYAHLTLHGRPRFDRTRTLSLTVLNRAVTLYGFSPQLTLSYDVRLTNAQTQGFDRSRAELSLQRQF